MGRGDDADPPGGPFRTPVANLWNVGDGVKEYANARRALPGLVTGRLVQLRPPGPGARGRHPVQQHRDRIRRGAGRRRLVGLRSRVYSAPGQQVLDWRFLAVLA